MSKAYSNKALPPGTILREWRLEEVLGVGGFGIVYRARGIYFDELVAIKEYFPSSISERDDEDTVVPIDSDAEEVHALGLKKFVEEAKLLWNLSTPSRHPNIVSVRSLFEIHGTAYMVMDFEDGISLSKLLKQGRRFNERSLLAIIRPVAEGLDRAHRVGVLHRDIKPANILINDSGRPVLIDFGSARFEAAEATSTKVTFHTPPYAALEQYVKTLDQGPWTDIYALGVVMYECVTGEKPPEVLERMHGGKDQALATGRWPGYSKRFLAAVDAAMAIRPQDRPQTISDWLALIDGKAGNHSSTIEIDEDATRVAAYDMAAEQIMPVGAATAKPLDTGVPATPKDARFKRAGGDTGTARKLTGSGDPPRRGRPRKPVPEPEVAAQAAPKPSPPDGTAKRRLSPLVAGGGALALVLVGAAGWLATRDPGQDRLAEGPAAAVQAAAPGTSVGAGASAAAVQSLLQDARAAGAPAPLVTSLAATAAELDAMQRQLEVLRADPARNNEAPALAARMEAIVRDAGVRFAAGLLADSQEAGRRLAADVPWAAVPARAGTAERRQAATAIGTASAALRTAAQPASPPRTATDAIAAAREALAQWQRFVGGVTTAYRLQAVPVIERPDRQALVERSAAERAAPAPALPAAQQARTSSQPAAPAPEPASAAPVADASLSRFNAIVDEGRSMARQVIRMGERSRGGSSPEERAAHELRRSNAQLARGYDSYLAKLRDSMRGVSTDREAQRLIKDASQTRAYVQFLVKRSSESLNP